MLLRWRKLATSLKAKKKQKNSNTLISKKFQIYHNWTSNTKPKIVNSKKFQTFQWDCDLIEENKGNPKLQWPKRFKLWDVKWRWGYWVKCSTVTLTPWREAGTAKEREGDAVGVVGEKWIEVGDFCLSVVRKDTILFLLLFAPVLLILAVVCHCWPMQVWPLQCERPSLNFKKWTLYFLGNPLLVSNVQFFSQMSTQSQTIYFTNWVSNIFINPQHVLLSTSISTFISSIC